MKITLNNEEIVSAIKKYVSTLIPLEGKEVELTLHPGKGKLKPTADIEISNKESTNPEVGNAETTTETTKKVSKRTRKSKPKTEAKSVDEAVDEGKIRSPVAEGTVEDTDSVDTGEDIETDPDSIFD